MPHPEHLQAIYTALNDDSPVARLRLSLDAGHGLRQAVSLEALAEAIATARGTDAIAAALGLTPDDVVARLAALSEDDQDRVESLIEEAAHAC